MGEREQLAMSMRRTGATYKQIADHFGVSASRASQLAWKGAARFLERTGIIAPYDDHAVEWDAQRRTRQNAIRDYIGGRRENADRS